MKVIGITGQKGGSGKTTLSVNLAAWCAEQGLAVSILDRAPQSAVAHWSRLGTGFSFPVQSDLGVTLGNAIAARRRQKDDIVIIDTDPSVGGAFAEVPAVADLILLPVPPQPLEIIAANTAYNILRADYKRTKSVYGVLTKVFHRFTITRTGIEALDDLRIPCLHEQIMHRAIYINSCGQGHTVFSYPATSQEKRALNDAQQEIGALGTEIFNTLKISPK